MGRVGFDRGRELAPPLVSEILGPRAVKRLGLLETPDPGNEDRGMPKELANGKPTTRRYSVEEKAAAVRMARTLHADLGVTQGTVQRVATQLG